MIKYLGEKVTPTQAAKIWFFSRGADSCCNPFDPDQSTCFGDTLEEMPTKKEQRAFWSALVKQEFRVAKFLGLAVGDRHE